MMAFEEIGRSLVTFSRKDPEFLSHLDGSFSLSHRALPIRSLNIGTQFEEVTFQVVPVGSIEKPSSADVVRALIRPSSLVFSLGPMTAVFARIHAQGLPFEGLKTALVFIGILAFHIALNLFNDYGDHMKGQDRVRPHGGSRAIQKGWVRAVAVRKIAMGLIGLATLCSIPSIVASPVIIIAGIALLVALEFAFQRLRLKARGLSEILAFALAGPLIALGFEWAVAGIIEYQVAAMGFIFGSIALMYFHSANFENIMPDAQAGAVTWATRAGFDASKTFFFFTVVLTLVSTAVLIFAVERNIRLLPTLLTQILALLPVGLRVNRLASPLASELQGLRVEPIRVAWFTTIALIGGYLWR